MFSGKSDSDVGLSSRFIRPRGALRRCAFILGWGRLSDDCLTLITVP